jgi:AcrR family transcriptional regulator
MVRATPLPPDERRAALIAATEPLLERFGREVSTKRIAEAAGVAEGTIFRVFPTKEALVDAVCDQVFDIGSAVAELERVDRNMELEAKLSEVVIIMQQRLRRIFALFHTLRMDHHHRDNPGQIRAKQHADNERMNAVIAALLSPDQARLRMPATEAANALRLMTLAMTHPILSEPQPHQPEQIVDLVLHGIAGAADPQHNQSSLSMSTGSRTC